VAKGKHGVAGSGKPFSLTLSLSLLVVLNCLCSDVSSRRLIPTPSPVIPTSLSLKKKKKPSLIIKPTATLRSGAATFDRKLFHSRTLALSFGCLTHFALSLSILYQTLIHHLLDSTSCSPFVDPHVCPTYRPNRRLCHSSHSKSIASIRLIKLPSFRYLWQNKRIFNNPSSLAPYYFMHSFSLTPPTHDKVLHPFEPTCASNVVRLTSSS
jgi:hypothetical protein